MKAGKLPLIYPTAGFAGLLFVLGAMWYAASSQNNAAVYLLFFALTAVFMVSIPHTLINLAGVTVTLESVQPAFVGQEVSLPLEIMNGSRVTRYGIELTVSGPNRERQRIDYIPGESQRHIDWRAVARGQPLMTKQFTAEEEGVVYFDFSGLHSTDVEEKLSQLALWVIEAERARRPYGLRLPGIEIPPSVGQTHFHQCLRALSLFEFDQRGAPTLPTTWPNEHE
ncbi:MAG TPA: DUF58 domain-containing protein [Candidatus Sulfotelmatobacter sp.]|nr:DUF58 domain-containing protein [Candidatus Sulfotelmatobacter sp.]